MKILSSEATLVRNGYHLEYIRATTGFNIPAYLLLFFFEAL